MPGGPKLACMQARCSRARRGAIPSVLRREDAATVLIHGCGSSATSCGSVACVVVILSKAREAMRSVCTVSWLKEFGRRTSLFAVRKGRGARDGWADGGRSCPTMPPSVRTSDKTSNQDRIATSMPTRGQGGGGARGWGYWCEVVRAPWQKSPANAKMAARDVPVRARARRSKVGMYAGSLQQGQAGGDSECPEASGCGYGAHTWWW